MKNQLKKLILLLPLVTVVAVSASTVIPGGCARRAAYPAPAPAPVPVVAAPHLHAAITQGMQSLNQRMRGAMLAGTLLGAVLWPTVAFCLWKAWKACNS